MNVREQKGSVEQLSAETTMNHTNQTISNAKKRFSERVLCVQGISKAKSV